MPKIGEHAVVLGASMGGLLAARVPPEFYDAVTVEERDVLPDNPVHRRGFRRAGTFMSCWDMAPKSWASCSPGLLDELVAAGAPDFDFDDLSRISLSSGGHQSVRSGRFKDHSPAFLPSRPLLECHVWRRVRAISNITMLEGHHVVALTSSTMRDRVDGRSCVCPRR